MLMLFVSNVEVEQAQNVIASGYRKDFTRPLGVLCFSDLMSRVNYRVLPTSKQFMDLWGD